MGPEQLRVLLVGKGGREHALAWKLSQSPSVAHVYVAPGNAGTAAIEQASNVDVAQDDFAGLVALAMDLKIGLVVVGPDDAVCGGIEGWF
jgi:phosphoribosylamine-glycine ligase